jgi:hypothetical protein
MNAYSGFWCGANLLIALLAGKVYFMACRYDVKLQADYHCPLGCGRKAEPQASKYT